MTDTIDVIMERLKNLQEYTVEIDLVEGYKLHGVVPYYTKISGNKGFFKVHALSYEEAHQRVTDYLTSQQ